MLVENPYQEDIYSWLISINMNTDYRFSTWGLLFACKWLEIKQKFCWTLCAFFYILLRKTSYLVTNPFSGLFYITLKLRSIICMEIIHHCLNLVITFNLLLIILHLILLLDCTPLNIVQIVKLIYMYMRNPIIKLQDRYEQFLFTITEVSEQK